MQDSAQSELPIADCFPSHVTPVTTSYRWNPNSLRETAGDVCIDYGRWHRCFGLWISNKRTKERHESRLIPDWPVLFRSSERTEAANISAQRSGQIADLRPVILGPKASCSFSSYLNEIPEVIQELCRPFGWMQWLALDNCNQIPDFYQFLHDERAAGRLGYIAAVFATIYAGEEKDRSYRRETGYQIMHNRRGDLLTERFQRPVTKSTVRIIERLPATIMMDDVFALLDALEEPNASCVLRHSQAVTLEVISALLELPHAFRTANIVRLVNEGVSPAYLEYAISYATETLDSAQIVEAARGFSAIGSIDEFEDWVSRWEKVGKERQFPNPPFKLDYPLVPISDLKALEWEGRSMRNCVAKYWREIADGKMYLFHWGGDEQASLSIVCSPDGKWQLQEALGYRNKELSDKTIFEIVRHLPGSVSDKNLIG
jgi:hypothetical protein